MATVTEELTGITRVEKAELKLLDQRFQIDIDPSTGKFKAGLPFPITIRVSAQDDLPMQRWKSREVFVDLRTFYERRPPTTTDIRSALGPDGAVRPKLMLAKDATSIKINVFYAPKGNVVGRVKKWRRGEDDEQLVRKELEVKALESDANAISVRNILITEL